MGGRSRASPSPSSPIPREKRRSKPPSPPHAPFSPKEIPHDRRLFHPHAERPQGLDHARRGRASASIARDEHARGRSSDARISADQPQPPPAPDRPTRPPPPRPAAAGVRYQRDPAFTSP